MSAAEALLARIVDYAGLFPPAAFDMETAVGNYQRYLAGEHAWMLGGFVLPAARLGEFTVAFERVCCGEREQPWTLNVVCAGETEEDVRAIEDFQQGAVFIGSVEAKSKDAGTAQDVLQRLPSARARYVEFPPARADEFLPVLAAQGARAKLRTGGVTAESIPAAQTIAKFLLACARERVAWKATAGLHHAMRGLRSLTPETGSATATMHGFLNVFLAGALSWFGGEEQAVLRTLEEQDASAFQLDEDVIRWHGHTLISDQLEQVRSHFAIGFGSCSFDEPVEDMQAMQWA